MCLKGASAGVDRWERQRQQGRESCERQPEAKTREESGRGWSGARASEFGAVSALSYYFHLPFPELSELLRSEVMCPEMCLSPLDVEECKDNGWEPSARRNLSPHLHEVHYSVALNYKASARSKCSF